MSCGRMDRLSGDSGLAAVVVGEMRLEMDDGWRGHAGMASNRARIRRRLGGDEV